MLRFTALRRQKKFEGNGVNTNDISLTQQKGLYIVSIIGAVHILVVIIISHGLLLVVIMKTITDTKSYVQIADYRILIITVRKMDQNTIILYGINSEENSTHLYGL